MSSFKEYFANTFGFGQSDTGSVSCDVEIQDGKAIGNPYSEFGTTKAMLSPAELDTAYERISCIGSSIDLISRNMQMVEPTFWDISTRAAIEHPKDTKLIGLRTLFEKPNSLDNRKSLIDKSVKNFVLHGCVYYAFLIGKDKSITSIKVLDWSNVSYIADVSSAKVSSYTVMNAGAYDGVYTFTGTYYQNNNNKDLILAPYINPSPQCQYLPASILQGSGMEALMYWYGCFHNKSLLSNGARPSLILFIKSLLNKKHREQLREEIRIRHSGASNAGNAIIIDGSADKDIKQFSQNNKDMEFSSVLAAAEEAIYNRLGTNWVLGKKVNPKDVQQGMEMFYDMTICPWFQGFYNHIFNVFKYFNTNYSKLIIFYVEQDIPALRPRFLKMMRDMPTLGIFTVKERRKMWNYEPLGDERDDELAVQSVSVKQTGASGTNTTSFSSSSEN